MQLDYNILAENGWKQDLKPVYFLGINISWLIMEEAYISPYDNKIYSYLHALLKEKESNR